MSLTLLRRQLVVIILTTVIKFNVFNDEYMNTCHFKNSYSASPPENKDQLKYKKEHNVEIECAEKFL